MKEDIKQNHAYRPWESPQWKEMLSRCTALEMFLFKTPLPLEPEDSYLLKPTVERILGEWELKSLPRLLKFYLFQGHDEDSYIEDYYWEGSNELIWRTLEDNKWTQDQNERWEMHLLTLIFGPKKEGL
ncbi:hypothetical protein JR316_0003885 [Psilocybe cubensis]|uniref:Uncharacterized protein n=2 Tax=Psilocybe cubensis TaxID=181762 RepID=A0ACB8H9A8_PSICU|nr:hypothetical protein JR316_0003885 [Psilocybe cubensis]KAH9484404.1 hypothetical protein JR316_0003885 [Psilocybe cubensis]